MQKLKKGKVKLTSLAAVALAMVMGTGLVAGTAFVSADDSASTTTSSLTKYYTDYNSMEDAKKAAEDLNRQIVGEGASLLKNKDEALPMKGSEWVSVFGVKSDNLVGASDSAGAWSSDSGGSDETVADALTLAGFKVNPTLKAFYQQDSSEIGAEVTDFPGTVDSSSITTRRSSYFPAKAAKAATLRALPRRPSMKTTTTWLSTRIRMAKRTSTTSC